MPIDAKDKAGPREELARSDELARAKPPPTLASLFANVHADPHTMATREDDVIDVSSVARMLRVGRNKIYEMVARNEIPHRRFGRGIRFSRTAIMRWLDSWSPRIAKEGQ
jgi:excisionase family DNA binding protein